MDWNLKKMWPAAAASLVAFTSFINAADDTQMRNLENRVSALEQRKGSNGMINPPARPLVTDGVDLFVQVSPFIWQAEQSGLEYALNWSNSVPSGNTSGSGRFKKPHFEWDWGFKLAAGYNTPHDGWDIFLQWTRFHPESMHSSTSVPTFGAGTPASSITGVVYPLLLPASTGIQGGNPNQGEPFGAGYAASMHWKFRLDLLDLELGREFFVSKWLTLRPHAGLRSAWLHQRSKVTYSGLIDENNTTVTNVQIPTINVGLKNNFWGMGPRAGLDAQWGLGCGWSLYSELAASLLLGHFNIVEIQDPAIDVTTALGVTGSSETFQEKYRAMRAAFDLAMGLRYQQLFACDRFGLMVQLGWEQHLFINQNQLIRLATSHTVHPSNINGYSFTPVTNQGDLGTQGVTLTVEFDF